MRDEFKSFKGLINKGYVHSFVEHNKDECGRGDVHVNDKEKFGVDKKMSKYYGVFICNLLYYLNEI